MYSAAIVERSVAHLESTTGLKIKRYAVMEVADRVEQLRKLERVNGTLKRSLQRWESEFVRNEQLISQVDFRYWAERYPLIERDPAVGPGGVGRMDFWESQNIALRLIAKIEEEGDVVIRAGKPADGVLILAHKARQLGISRLVRMLVWHRITTQKDVRSLAGSIDEKKIGEMYGWDSIILNGLPFYLKPKIEFDVKNEHISFSDLRSKVNYQYSRQESGFGQGGQWDVSHLTECAFWDNPFKMIQMDFFPAIPQSAKTMCFLESTSNGRRNWWHKFCTEAQSSPYSRWKLLFIPWYAEPKKYRRSPPASWKPDPTTTLHFDKVLETSPKYLNGQTVRLEPEQLYWWENTREEYRRNGMLNMFYMNYCATVEESFQHREQSAFPAELIEEMVQKSAWGKPFEYVR